MPEAPITRQEFDALKKRVLALEEWTKVAVDKVKALEALADKVREKLAADEKGEEKSDITWD